MFILFVSSVVISVLTSLLLLLIGYVTTQQVLISTLLVATSCVVHYLFVLKLKKEWDKNKKGKRGQ